MGGSDESETHDYEIIYFLFIGLVTGAGITWVLSRYAKTLPYSVVIFLAGILYGIGLRYRGILIFTSV